MIDATRDKLHHLTELAHRFLPKPPGPTGLWRWHKWGVLVNGKRIRLETIRVGRNRYTTEDAFRRFIEATNPDQPVDNDRADRQATTDAKLRERCLLDRPQGPETRPQHGRLNFFSWHPWKDVMPTSQDAAAPLFHTRAEKFQILDRAIAQHEFTRQSWRVSAHAYIKAAECHSTHDGWCHLRQQDMEDKTGCRDEKLKAIRDELARLGWIEVAVGCPTCGFPRAVVVRVNWPTIAASIHRQRPSGNVSGNPDSKPGNPEMNPEIRKVHNKEFKTHEAPCISPMQEDGACASDGVWPPKISQEMLRSPKTVDRLYRGAVGKGWLDPNGLARIGVHGAAIYTLERKGIRNPGGHFANLVKNKWWLKAPGQRGGMPDRIDDKARAQIRKLDSPADAKSSEAVGTTDGPRQIGDVAHDVMIGNRPGDDVKGAEYEAKLNRELAARQAASS